MVRIGDIFEAGFGDGKKKYFQVIASDPAQLNSDVIRVFSTAYSIESKLEREEIVQEPVEFYAHCIVKWGVKFGLWVKVGHSINTGTLDHILFRSTNDFGRAVGEAPVLISA